MANLKMEADVGLGKAFSFVLAIASTSVAFFPPLRCRCENSWGANGLKS